jgi:hypothetical protein
MMAGIGETGVYLGLIGDQLLPFNSAMGVP